AGRTFRRATAPCGSRAGTIAPGRCRPRTIRSLSIRLRPVPRARSRLLSLVAVESCPPNQQVSYDVKSNAVRQERLPVADLARVPVSQKYETVTVSDRHHATTHRRI